MIGYLNTYVQKKALKWKQAEADADSIFIMLCVQII